MSKTILSAEGSITIPAEIRDQLELAPGTELVINVQGNTLVLKRSISDLPHWSTMEGMAKGEDSLTDFLVQERRAEIARDEIRNKGC